MNPEFSIIFLSRSRVRMLSSLLVSIERTTRLPYEVIVGIDDDDDDTITASKVLSTPNVRFVVKRRSPNLHTFLNSLAKETKGNYIFGLNDDCELVNNGWDVESKKILDNQGPIWYGITQDNSIDKVSHGEYASFPVLSREAYNRLGCFIPEDLGNHGGDVILYRIFSEASIAYHKQMICQLPIQIRHIYHENIAMLNARLHESTAKEMIDRTMQENKLNSLFTINLTHYVKKMI